MSNLHFALRTTLRALIAGVCLITLSSPASLAKDTASQLESQLRQAVSQQPDQPETLLKLANFLLENMRKAWAQRDPNATGQAFQQQTDAIQRQTQELIALYEKIMALQPRNVEARVNLAEIYFVFLSQLDQAEVMLKQALETDPANPQALVAMAEFQFFSKNDHPAALALLEKSLQAQPDEPTLTISLADLLTGAAPKPEDFAKARQVLSSALKQHPGDHGLSYMLASVWYREANQSQPLNQEKASTALKLFLAELASKPDLGLVIEVAQVAQSMGRLPQARQIVEQGLKKFPADPSLRLLLGDLWLQQGASSLDQGQFSPEILKAESYYRALLNPADLAGLVSSQQVQLYYNLGLLSFLKGQAAKDNPAQALRFYQESDQMYRQAMAIFDRINIINRPLQQELAKTLEAMAQIQQSQSQQAEAIENYKRACEFKLESSCNWLKQNGIGQ